MKGLNVYNYYIYTFVFLILQRLQKLKHENYVIIL